MWTSTYLSFESYLPTSKCCWCKEFVKMKFRNLHLCWSAPQCFENIPSLGTNELLADGPCWHLWSWTGVWFSVFSAVNEWIGSDTLEIHGFNLRIKCWRRRRWIYKKRFPIYHVYSKYLAAYQCGLSILQDHDKVEKRWLTGNVGLSTAYWFSIFKNLSNHSYDWFHSVIPESWLWIQG